MSQASRLPDAPTGMSWRKKSFRTSFFKKIPLSLVAQFVFELASEELRLLSKSGHIIPTDHLELLSVAHYEIFDYGLKWAVKKNGQPDSERVSKKINQCRSFLYAPCIERGSEAPVFYRCVDSAVRFYARVFKEDELIKVIRAAPQRAYQIIDWDEQVEMLNSLIAVNREFGLLIDDEKVAVGNDWLEERGLRSVLFQREAIKIIGRA